MPTTVNQPTSKPHSKVIASTVGALVGATVVAAADWLGVTVPADQIVQAATATVGAFVAGWLKKEGYTPPPGDEPDGGTE